MYYRYFLGGFSAKAGQVLKRRKITLIGVWMQTGDHFGSKKSYHYTAPVSGITAIRSLRWLYGHLSLRFDVFALFLRLAAGYRSDGLGFVFPHLLV